MDVNFLQIALVFLVTFVAAIDQFDFTESLYQPIVTARSSALSSAMCRPASWLVVPTSS